MGTLVFSAEASHAIAAPIAAGGVHPEKSAGRDAKWLLRAR